MGPAHNFYSIFYPNLMHEFELGVWKAVFTHPVRIFWADGGGPLSQLTSR